MKKLKYISLCSLFVAITMPGLRAQQQKTDLNLNLAYYDENGGMQYLKASAKTKVNGRFQPVGGIPLRFYIGNDSPSSLLGRGISNAKGEAVVFIPASAGPAWKQSEKHSFMVQSDATPGFDASKASTDVTEARIKLDTTDDRKIVATLLEKKEGSWLPVKGVDLKVAVKRLGGDLNVNETPTYTTDSTGSVTAEFKRDSLPGDSAGRIVLVARMEDNDIYGNVSVKKTVPWGVHYDYISHFDQRTLFARRGHSPIWLELMAYGIGIAVWAVLFYLALQIRRLQRLGSESPARE